MSVPVYVFMYAVVVLCCYNAKIGINGEVKCLPWEVTPHQCPQDVK